MAVIGGVFITEKSNYWILFGTWQTMAAEEIWLANDALNVKLLEKKRGKAKEVESEKERTGPTNIMNKSMNANTGKLKDILLHRG